jgi:hypothetical protein
VAVVVPYVDTQVFTEQDRGRSQGDWVIAANDIVLAAAETTQTLAFGTVDYQGRPMTAYVSAARTATPTASVLYSRGATGLKVTIIATAAGTTPSVVFSIQGYDAASAAYVTLLASTAITGAGTTTLTISPNIATAANASLNSVIPDTLKVVATHGNSTSLTYSVGLVWTP